MQEPKRILKQLGLSESETTVYLALVAGRTTARDIIRDTGEKRPTVYHALSSLERRGLLSKSGKETGQRLRLEPLERLEHLVDQRRTELDQLQHDVAAWQTSVVAQQGVQERPHVSFYEGVEAMKNSLMDTLYCRSKHIRSIAPADNFAWQVGADFVEQYVSRRRERGIQTDNLWEKAIDPEVFATYYSTVSSVRLLPEVMHGSFHTSIFLYDDKTLYVSSRQNAYSVLITSQEHHNTMLALFRGLWESSTPHPTA